MSFQNFDHDDEVIGEINVTPLVDVMLVLLIIFILTMPLLNQLIKIELPKSDIKSTTHTIDSIQISVTQDASLYWNESKISLQELKRRFVDIAMKNEQSEILVRGDRQANYGHIMLVMEAAEKAGIHRLGFVTRTESQ